LPLFFQGDCLERIDTDYFHDTSVDFAEECDIIEHSDFFAGCRLLVEDPSSFKYLLADVQRQVRLAAAKYLSSLPLETKLRCNACIDKT